MKIAAMVLLALIAVGATAARPAPASRCASVAGTEPLLAMADRRYFILGELHGTAETAALFGDLVCRAAARSPVVVGLEMEEGAQPVLDAYMASDGGAAARAALLRHTFWRYRDGRASLAMVGLIERLRVLKAAGAPIRLLAFVPIVARAATQTPYEQAMAANWRRALAAAPRARLLVLVGNVHSRTTPFRDFEPAAMHLPREQTLTFAPLPLGGTAYNCQQDGCGPHPAGTSGVASLPRGMTRVPAEARAAAPYDYFYSTGGAFTASPPALPAPPAG
jgi:hypothetical protein